MKRYIAVSILLLVLTFLLPTLVSAEENESMREKNKEKLELKKAEVEERLQEKKEKMVENREKRCEVIESRVAEKITKYEENKSRNIGWYKEFTDKLTTAAKKLEDKGLDVNKLREDLKEFDKMVDEYVSLYEDFIASLKNSQQYACGESEGAFKDAVKDAIAKHKLAVQKRKEIFEFYKNVVREDIRALRESLPETEKSTKETRERVTQ